jgi:GAF domain-containing protein
MTDYTHLIPANDPQRLAALQAYHLLGKTPDTVFDELVRLVAQLFGVPIALISLVAKDTVEFAGNFGLSDVRVVDRPDSICSVAVLHETTTLFEDLHADPCQLTNQVAAQQFNMGFYAGHPLHTRTGYNIGSLCVIDHQPRTLSGLEQQRLATLADVVLDLFDLRLAVLERPKAAQAMWDAIHRRIGTSLTRIDTLRALSQWEESNTTPAAQQYQRSIEEEAHLVIQDLRDEVKTALRQVATT